MKVTRIYSGDDGESHFEDVEISLRQLGGAIGALSKLETATDFKYVRTAKTRTG